MTAITYFRGRNSFVLWLATISSGFTWGPPSRSHSAPFGDPLLTLQSLQKGVPCGCPPRGEGWARGGRHLCSASPNGSGIRWGSHRACRRAPAIHRRTTPAHLHMSAAEISCHPLCLPRRKTFRLESAPSLQPAYLVARCYQTEGLQHCASADVKLVLIANSFSPVFHWSDHFHWCQYL